MSKVKRKYTYRPDLPDQRDHYFAAVDPAALPPRVDLTLGMSKVEDQGQLGSCTANAAVALAEYQDRKSDGHYRNYSRLFVYYNERVLEGTVGQDSGASIRDAIRSMAKCGVCLETEWPYAIAKFKAKPPAAAFKSGAKRKALEYARVNQAQADICSALAAGFPVEIGFTVYESFESAVVAKTGIVPMPGRDEQALGGHAVVIVGYDVAAKTVTCRNSWGSGWGMKGYFTMPFDYVLNPDLAEDFWVVRQFQGIK
jgi:C1A family cysteine protease